MKIICLTVGLVLTSAFVHSQNYHISFVGIGASSIVDSVKVENLTQCTNLVLSGGSILHLSATAGMADAETNNKKLFSLYPNPFIELCNIEFEAPLSGNTSIEIYSVEGMRIIGIQKILKQGLHRFQVSGIGSGVYFIQVRGESWSYFGKILSNCTGTIMPNIVCQNLISPFLAPEHKKLETINNGKDVEDFVQMQYNDGDRLKITGKSGIYRTVFMLVPTQDQTVTFNFIDCTDGDDNHYPVVQIGGQIWMAENMKTTKFRDGTTIPFVPDDQTWLNLSEGFYCTYNNTNNADTINMYGCYYNYFALIGAYTIAPAGWHVPTDAEWTTLSTFLGGDSIAGGKMKEHCLTHWSVPDSTTNESGFSAIPAGCRSIQGPILFEYGGEGFWWSSTNYCNNTTAFVRFMYYGDSVIARGAFPQHYGFSVRCVKD